MTGPTSWSPDDPSRDTLAGARYRWTGHRLIDKQNVLEIGCGDGRKATEVLRAIKPHGGRLTVTDENPDHVLDVRANRREPWMFDAHLLDITCHDIGGRYDGIYMLDVLEHIPSASEKLVLSRICWGLTDHGGMLIIGMPSLESQVHASPISRLGHVNCKTGEELRALLSGFFWNVVMFGMNDLTVANDFLPMAHYLFAICTEKRT